MRDDNPKLNANQIDPFFHASPELPKNPSHLAQSAIPFFFSFG